MIHHVFANKSNIGDWLSARGIQHMLRPNVVIEHLCDEVFVPQTLAELSRLGPDDLVVIGGGGLFMDYFAPFWRGLLTMSDRLRYCIWGVGLCDLKAEPSRPPLDLIQSAVRRSELCFVRDELTRAYLADKTIPAPVACPSLAEIDRSPPGWGVLHVDNYTTVGAPAFDAMDTTCRDFASRTARPYRRTNNRLQPGRATDLAMSLELYLNSDLIVSSALHGCIIAVAMERPVLAVSGDRKIEGFMEAAGLGDWVVDHADLEQILPKLQSLSRQPSARPFVESAVARNREIALKIVELAGTQPRSFNRSGE